MDDQACEAAAVAFAAAWNGGDKVTALPEGCAPATIEEGYRVQEALHRLLDRPTKGWKLAHSSPAAMRTQNLVGPPAGRLYAGTLFDSPARLRGDLFHRPKFEPELAFRLARDLPARDAPYGTEEVADGVAAMLLAIEIADSRFADPGAMPLPCLLADNMATGALIVGPDLEDWRSIDAAAIPVRLLDGNTVVGDGLEGDARCDPLTVLTWLANWASRRGEGLEAGMIVSTGSHTPPAALTPPVAVTGHYGDLGEVRVALTG